MLNTASTRRVLFVFVLGFFVVAVDMRAERQPNLSTRNSSSDGDFAARQRRHEALFLDTLPSNKQSRKAKLFAVPASTVVKKPAVPRQALAEPQAKLVTASPEFPVRTVLSRDNRRTIVFIVHGTYGAEGQWYLNQAGRSTFASEVQRAIGSNCIIRSLPWYTDNTHATRLKVAATLATEIFKNTTSADKIVLIGHSHGGNIVLSALENCGRIIDTVICLSTPHICFPGSDANGVTRMFPVYFSPKAGRSVKNVLCVVADTDGVIPIADRGTGVDNNDAIAAISGWRNAYGGISLNSDRDPFDEFLFGKELTETHATRAFNQLRVSFVSANATLVKPVNIIFRSQFVDGKTAHSTTHSRRMGFLVGSFVKQGSSPGAYNYLTTYTESLHGTSLDLGEPIPSSRYIEENNKRISMYKHAGWILHTISVKVPHYNLPDDPVPDPYYFIYVDGASYRGAEFVDRREFIDQPNWIIRKSGLGFSFAMDVHEKNYIDDNHRHGNFQSSRLTTKSQVKINYSNWLEHKIVLVDKEWRATLNWLSIHH